MFVVCKLHDLAADLNVVFCDRSVQRHPFPERCFLVDPKLEVRARLPQGHEGLGVGMSHESENGQPHFVWAMVLGGHGF